MGEDSLAVVSEIPGGIVREQILNLIAPIKNPVSGQTFTQEDRWKEIVVDGEKVTISYDREGISPQEKRLVEKMIIENLSGIVKEEDITLKSISANSADVFRAASAPTQAPAPAQIKTGHAAPMAKNRYPA